MAHKNKTNTSPYKTRLETKGMNGPRTTLGRHEKPVTIYPIEEANDRLQDIFRNHGFDLVSHTERRHLAQFYHVLMQHQQSVNLTRLLKFNEIAIKHFIDSLWIVRLTELQFPLLDLGTGPGFPGIPLKIKFPEERILLGEGVQKRVEFLKTVRSELKLKNLDIVGRNIDHNFVYPVRGVITRAVEDISNTLGHITSCLELGGRMYFMKGPGVDPEIEAASKKWQGVFRLVDNISYQLPKTTNDRRLVIFEKIKHLPFPEDLEEAHAPELTPEQIKKFSRDPGENGERL